jgi:hypothetical protein
MNTGRKQSEAATLGVGIPVISGSHQLLVKGKERFSPEPLERALSCCLLDLQLQASRTVREYIPPILNHPDILL